MRTGAQIRDALIPPIVKEIVETAHILCPRAREALIRLRSCSRDSVSARVHWDGADYHWDAAWMGAQFRQFTLPVPRCWKEFVEVVRFHRYASPSG